MNLYDFENVGSYIAYVLDINGDEEWEECYPSMPRQTPKEVARLAHKLTCSDHYNGRNRKRTAYRKLIRLAKECCPDLLSAAEERLKELNEDKIEPIHNSKES